jgi:hypothetical protein
VENTKEGDNKMKTRTLTLLSVALLSVLVLGAGGLLTLLGQEVLKINVAWDPRSYTWDIVAPEPWNAGIWRHKVKERYINSTLEDKYEPFEVTPAVHGPRLILSFHGEEVKACIYEKLPKHMGVLIPGRYRIKLKISGWLMLEGVPTPFEGYGVIRVTVPEPGE